MMMEKAGGRGGGGEDVEGGNIGYRSAEWEKGIRY